MATIDLPDTKRVLWETMRADLVSIAPTFSGNELLMCPACCRPLPFSAFTLEHILPQQALKNDPIDVRATVSKNDRSGLTLLCNRALYIKGVRYTTLGCNARKGSHYDRFLKETLHRDKADGFHIGHHLALVAAAYLGAFRAFGYAFALTHAGSLLRRQFFSSRHWLEEMPTRCQMVLMSQPAKAMSEELRAYWSEPFKFAMQEDILTVVVRSLCLHLPISRDPTVRVAKRLLYAPPKHILKPDLSSFFD